MREGQASRFATLLLYLNEGMEGGETSFPRWLNGETTEILEVKPEVGKAVLFYNVLPDGNYDERSQHAAKPVIKGEKWLTNLWVWVSTTNQQQKRGNDPSWNHSLQLQLHCALNCCSVHLFRILTCFKAWF